MCCGGRNDRRRDANRTVSVMSDFLPMFKVSSPNEQLITNQVNSRLIVSVRVVYFIFVANKTNIGAIFYESP